MKLISLASLTAVSAEMLFWEDFKSLYGKVYMDESEHAVRQQIYEANVQQILEHNAQNETWTMAMNEFGDLTHKEFVTLVAGKPKDKEFVGEKHVNMAEGTLSSSKDWVSEGVVNPIRNQGHTNSCWAHSAAGCLESVYAIATGQLVQLSEQQLCDCSGAGSCADGGDEQDALPWYKSHGACARDSYPLNSNGRDGTCQSCNVVLPAGTVTGTNLVDKDASSWRNALNVAPLTMGVFSSDLSQFYSSGVFSETRRGGVITGSCSGEVDHAMIAVGYGTQDGQDYFKLRNSWGTSWGQHGYGKVAAQNSASLGTACIYRWKPMYPTVRGSPLPSPWPSSCSDSSGWENKDGESCNSYESHNYCTSSGGEGSGWKHRRWGSISDWTDGHGVSALEACCACGGGAHSVVV